jgi:hypothetical protein
LGNGEDAAKLDEKEKARLRGQALAWLRADLVLWSKQLSSGKAADRVAVQAKMQHWQKDEDLAGVRGKEALAALPEAERQAWEKLWAEVAAGTTAEVRRRSAAVTRQLRRLRAQGLIHKVPKTHRYLVSDAGRRAITALLAARNASAEELTRCAG